MCVRKNTQTRKFYILRTAGERSIKSPNVAATDFQYTTKAIKSTLALGYQQILPCFRFSVHFFCFHVIFVSQLLFLSVFTGIKVMLPPEKKCSSLM